LFDYVEEKLPMTNNYVEAWHRSFEFTMQNSGAKLDVYRLLEKLCDEFMFNVFELRQYFSGILVKRKKKIMQAKTDNQILETVSMFSYLIKLENGRIQYLEHISDSFRLN